MLSGVFTVKEGFFVAAAAGWTGFGAAGGLALIALGSDQIISGAHNIYNRMNNKDVEAGTLIQKGYRFSAQKITGKENSTLERTLDTLYFSAEVVSACATATISVRASVSAIKSVGPTYTATRIVPSNGYLKYDFYLKESVSVYEAGTVVATESFSTVISGISFVDSSNNTKIEDTE